MPTYDPTLTVAQQSQTTSNRSSFTSYPPPTAKYEQLVQSSDLFWEKLRAFHHSLGTKFMVPTVGGQSLDLHGLFVQVTSRGGLEKVIRDHRWKEVISTFNFPSTITSISFVLRKYYMSLLYHFEQVYHFHKEAPSVAMQDTRNFFSESTTLDESASQLRGQCLLKSRSVAVLQINGRSFGCRKSELQLGSSVTGTIDGKFDNGYLVTVNLGSNQLKGVLYHIPHSFHEYQKPHGLDVPPAWRRKRSRLLLSDPSRPKSNRSGYNFFFAEHYARLKPQYYGQERIISKKIGLLWNNLTEAEKQVYQEKGLKDKERYRTEMLEYKSSYEHLSGKRLEGQGEIQE